MEFDAIVIGAGAGGSAACWRLTQSGLRVACFERGGWPDPSSYPSTRLDWELLKRGKYSYRPSIRQLPADYLIDTCESDIDIANFNGVGGATVLFSGHFPRFHPGDFCMHTLDGVGVDWPLGYVDLEPYYRINDRMMRVSGLSGDPAYPPIDDLLPPVDMGDYGHRIAQGFNKLGWHWWPSYAAISTRRESGAPCINLGPCNTGCAQGAKSSTDVTYIPQAIKNGLSLFANAIVSRIDVDESGRVAGVRVKMADGEIKAKAKIVIVAANAIGTARLLLASKCRQFPDGLANSSGMLGRNLMLHPLGYAEGLFEQPTDVDRGPQGCCIYSHEFYETDHQRGFARGYTLHLLRGGGWLETASAGLQRHEIEWGANFVNGCKALHRRRAGIAVICEDLPEPCNRVELDMNRIDRDGMPVAKVYYRIGKNTKAMMNHGMGRARQVLMAAGLKKTMAFGPVREAGWHLLGTARMGNDPVDSVVDRGGECHDVPGLFVADGSIFPSSAGVNPASTLQALALYVSDHAYGRYFTKRNFSHESDGVD